MVSPETNVRGLQVLSVTVTPVIGMVPRFVTVNVYVTDPDPAGNAKGLGIFVTLISGGNNATPLPVRPIGALVTVAAHCTEPPVPVAVPP